jgi:hypothetical protein
MGDRFRVVGVPTTPGLYATQRAAQEGRSSATVTIHGMEAARSRAQRRSHLLARLERDADLWVASATADGDAHLIPLSFGWDGERLTIAVSERSLTARNLTRAGRARVGVGETRDVAIIEGPIEVVPVADADPALADAHARQAGFDAREAGGSWLYLRLRPERIQAWREENELADRLIMADGAWLD